MPLARYQIRDEYSLADPELYRAADKDDPEALLEGVAMAGLVGVLRQLGDLAEFAAKIFHDLHEEVMVTAARGHGLMARVQQLEAEVPSIEKAFLSQTHHSPFFSNGGIDWHPNLQSEQNLIARGDLPRFVMDSYEECRGPPRLFLLDKFDVAGAGACLKRYTDPSFFKVESDSSGIATVEVHREKRTRKVKKRGTRLRNGETPEVVPTHAKLHELFLEECFENGLSDPARLVKLKKRHLNGSLLEAKTGKSYMEKFLESPSPDNKIICETSITPLCVKQMSDDSRKTGIKILEISPINPVKRSMGNESTCSSPDEQGSVLKPSSERNRETDGDLVKVHEQMPAHATDELSSNHHKVVDETDFAVNEEKKTEGSLDGYHSDDVNSEADNYLDALTTMEMESELETDNESRPKNSLLNIQKVTDSDGKEEEQQLQARFLDSQSSGGSLTSDDISSFKRDRNEEDTELQARLSDSQSSGTSFTSDETSSFRRDRSEEQMELQAHFSDFQSIGNSSTSDENSTFKKDRPFFSQSNSLSTVVENIQSELIVLPSTKCYESKNEDTPFDHQIVELHETDCGKFVMHDEIHVQEEEVFDSGQASSSSCPVNSGPTLLHSDLVATPPVTLPTETESDETTPDPVELHSRFADDVDRKCLVESIAAVPDSHSLVKDDACPAVSLETYPLKNLGYGDFYVHSDTSLQMSNDIKLAPEDESNDHSEIKVLQAESLNENSTEILVSREIGSPGEHRICPSMYEGDSYSGTTLPLDGLDSKTEDGIVATQVDSQDLSSLVGTAPVSSFTREQCSELTHDSPQDEPDSGVEVLYSDQQSTFEETSRIVLGNELSTSTCSVNAVEDDDHLKPPSSPDYIGQHNQVMVNDVVTDKVQLEHQAVSAFPSVDSAEDDASITTCSASGLITSPSRNLANFQEPPPSSSDAYQKEMESNEIEPTETFVDWNAEKRENQLEPSSGITYTTRDITNSEESLPSFEDPHEKEMEINEAVPNKSLAELGAQKIVDQPEVSSADVKLNLNRSLPCDISDSEIFKNIQDLSLKEKIQYGSFNYEEMLPEISELGTQESESTSLCQNDLLYNDKDGLSSLSYNPLESETPLEQLLQSQVGQQDADYLCRNEGNFALEKLQSQQKQISNLLELEIGCHAASESAPETHLIQSSSSKLLSQSVGQEIKPTKHVMDPLKPLLPNPLPKATEINLGEMPPMPPLPPVQWRMGKVQHASFASQRDAIEVSQTSFQPTHPVKTDDEQLCLPTSERETLQYQNPFLPVMAVEGDKLQHTSGFSLGVSGHPIAIPLQFPVMFNEANGQYNYLLLERSQLQSSFLTLPLVSAGRPPHGYVVASEGEIVQYSNPHPPVQPVECAVSQHDPVSPLEKPTQPPNHVMEETNLEVETHQQSSSNLEGERGDSSTSPISPQSIEIMLPNHSPLPSEGGMALSLDTSALTSDFECEKPKNKLPRPRNPLIDAVAAHDKSKLRKVGELVRPQVAPNEEERDSLLEQIRTKSFNLKRAAVTRPSIQGPKTNLKVAAILEKANAIRQALAGSDEDDDEDNWSDS